MPKKHTTQFVVCAADESDSDIFQTVMTSYEKYSPARIYYSAFHALEETPLNQHPNTPLWRANRWYQVDALLRLYGYSRSETSPVFDEDGMLMNTDPKILLARTLPAVNPADATYEELLRVPGIGPISARKIVELRKTKNIKEPSVLRESGLIIKRAMPYLSLPRAKQMKLSSFL